MRTYRMTSRRNVYYSCSGRRECTISVSEPVFGQPCPHDLKSYLEIGYSCVPGKTGVNGGGQELLGYAAAPAPVCTSF